MKIGIIKETKNPIDNRVALTPAQIKALAAKYPDHSFSVQKSDIRAYSDTEYETAGVTTTDDLSDCDILLGIKEARIDSLYPDKHYIFFGHIAKMQKYNKPLLLAMMDKGITFSDYEYLTDEDGNRVAAFGWYAGAVGVYYTLRGWGMRTGKYSLPEPDMNFSISEIIDLLSKTDLGNIRIVVTGEGRVSQGAQHILENCGFTRLDNKEYLAGKDTGKPVFTVAGVKDLVCLKDSPEKDFELQEFFSNPSGFNSSFFRFAKCSDILITGHLWQPGQPVYLTPEDLANPENRLKMIGDVTCDIMGSIKSTLRSSTHDNPFYDYNPCTAAEEPAFSSPDNITVMAVDTCPNAIPRETSEFFGEKLITNVIEPLLQDNSEFSDIVNRSTILRDGKITDRFGYLREYASSND